MPPRGAASNRQRASRESAKSAPHENVDLPRDRAISSSVEQRTRVQEPAARERLSALTFSSNANASEDGMDDGPSEAAATTTASSSSRTPAEDSNGVVLPNRSGHVPNGDALSYRRPPASTAQSMLRLMRKTRGRMRGSVLVRRRSSHPWQQTYCTIETDGTLRSEQKDDGVLFATLLRDLCGCNVYALLDDTNSTAALHVRSVDGADELQLKTTNHEHLDRWFAALLCWQPAINKLEIRQRSESRRSGRTSRLAREHILADGLTGVVQSHIATLLEEPDTGTYQSLSHAILQTEVLCTLNGDGSLILELPTSDQTPVASVMLGGLPRNAVQRLDKHVFGRANMLAIYPQYALSSKACSRLRPLFLSYDSTESLEVWFVLLRTFAIPEIFCASGSQISASSPVSPALARIDPGDLSTYLRTELSLAVLVSRVTFRTNSSTGDDAVDSGRGAVLKNARQRDLKRYFVDILVDEQVKARTTICSAAINPSWFERYTLHDIPNSASTVSIRVQSIDSQEPSDSNDCHDGQTSIKARELINRGDLEQSWPIIDDAGSNIGDIYLGIRCSQDHILALEEYDQMLDVLLDVSNTLTLRIWRHMPAHLATLAELFLNIFQSSGRVMEWLKSLATEEIKNGTRGSGNPPPPLSHDETKSFDGQPLSTTSHAVKETLNSAVAETSILFRANTLLTKALELHLKRIGGAYIEATIGEHMRTILAKDLDFEVDPTRVPLASEADLESRWRQLLSVTKDIWTSIFHSTSTCPSELKAILRHIRDCARDHFGYIAPKVAYSSVSGFLFLRFFCPAIMNPHLFGLINGQPGSRTHRTYLLVAKGIQGLSNQTSFGAKESWMSPMNSFYSEHRHELTGFIDSICAAPHACGNGNEDQRQRESAISSKYAIPLAIYERLQPVAREGSLSLPHLIDQSRNLAALVDLWINNFDHSGLRISPSKMQSAPPTLDEGATDPPNTLTLKTLTSILNAEGDNEYLATFHAVCQAVRERTTMLIDLSAADADIAEDTNTREDAKGVVIDDVSQKWVKIAERMETCPEEFWVDKVPAPHSPQLSSAATSFGRARDSQERSGDAKQTPISDDIDTRSSTSSESKCGRQRRNGIVGTARGNRKSKHKESDSTESADTAPEASSRAPKKRRPSPPRDREQNALRKLGWI